MENAIICTPMEMEFIFGPPSTKGIKVPCTQCDKPCWLSDSAVSAVKQANPGIDLEKKPPVIVCVLCCVEFLKKNPGKLMPPSEEQIKEIFGE